MQLHLVEKVTALRAQARVRNGNLTKEPQPSQLTLWPEWCAWADNQRGVPNALLRSALFAAIQGKGRRMMQRELLAAVDGIEVRFTGMQLEQSDLNVWETVIHFARLQGSNLRVEFTAYALLRALNLNTGRAEHEWLKQSFARLFSARIEVTAGRFTYGGTLLKLVRDEITRRYVVHLEREFLNLFEAGWTRIDWEVRLKLRRKPLALWLHGMYSSHADPYPYSIQKIRELSGSSNHQTGGFTQQLKKALQALKEAGAIDDYEVGSGLNGLVKVWRTPSESQKRHLSNKPLRRTNRPSRPSQQIPSTQLSIA